MDRGRQGGRQRGTGRWWGWGGDTEDKGGTSQIGNISFQHVLTEHFICERRLKGGGLTPRFKGLSQSSVKTTANSSTAPEGLKCGELLSNTCNTSTDKERERSRDECNLKKHIILNSNRTLQDFPLSLKNKNWCLQPASIFIWTQVGLNPDGTLDHLFASSGLY